MTTEADESSNVSTLAAVQTLVISTHWPEFIVVYDQLKKVKVRKLG